MTLPPPLAGLALPAAVVGTIGAVAAPGFGVVLAGLALLASALWAATRRGYWVEGFGALVAAALLLRALPAVADDAGIGFWGCVLAAWLLAWHATTTLSAWQPRAAWLGRLQAVLVPLLFGLWLLVLWELIVRGAGVPSILLPAPSAIGARIAGSLPILWADFQQTYLRAVLTGYAIGCSVGFVAALLIDRSPFLTRGLLPVGNMVSALPIIGTAPIMVMWFGFDWHSKAAVVVVMTFFPMMVNTLAGLKAASRIDHDLMQTYAASYGQTLWKMRLPLAMPFVFNALKINSTLALIGAIVAEFFGSPTVGMGFRISTEIGRMNIDMVWAQITMAAVVGSASYGLIALIERGTTFWHPSYRR
ncbi:MAG: ABC transporter permease [Geminicoccaceae bacterium]|nr:MAG: ABC transporter permease [Geminicoccaceae bacterium]